MAAMSDELAAIQQRQAERVADRRRIGAYQVPHGYPDMWLDQCEADITTLLQMVREARRQMAHDTLAKLQALKQQQIPPDAYLNLEAWLDAVIDGGSDAD